MANATARPRVVTTLISPFGTLSLLLVAVGLYGTIAFSVASRTRELGLRASLGAKRITLGGITLGIGGSLWATLHLQDLLFGVRPVDAMALIAASAALLLVAILSAYLPVRRATRIDPMVALRRD